MKLQSISKIREHANTRPMVAQLNPELLGKPRGCGIVPDDSDGIASHRKGENLVSRASLKHRLGSKVEAILTAPLGNTDKEHFQYNNRWAGNPDYLAHPPLQPDPGRQEKRDNLRMPRLQTMQSQVTGHGVLANRHKGHESLVCSDWLGASGSRIRSMRHRRFLPPPLLMGILKEEPPAHEVEARVIKVCRSRNWQPTTAKKNKTLPGQARTKAQPIKPWPHLSRHTPAARSLGAHLRRAILPALLLASHPGTVLAAPTGGEVVAGEGRIEQQGTRTDVTQRSERMVVDWQEFNVGEQEHVHFEQPSVQSSVLNRIYQGSESRILGRLSGRGQVWLLNPNGVLFGKNSRVNVGGLVAAGLWMGAGDFMAGRYVLDASRGVGRVRNAGVLEASSSGIGLAGSQVENTGQILAYSSRVELAAGSQVVVDFDGDGLLRFAVREGAPGGVINAGTLAGEEVILSARAASGVFTQVLNTGAAPAGAVYQEAGQVSLTAASRIQGEEVSVSGETVVAGGEIDASSAAGDGGRVSLVAEESLEVSASITTSSKTATGGVVTLMGEEITLGSETNVDVSGAIGGGRVRVGGEYQGEAIAGRTAASVTVAEGAEVTADASARGDGGGIIFWSEGTTDFAGWASARGGPQGGDGGLVEVSGRERIIWNGGADLRASWGRTGLLLLDPGTVRICDDSDATCTAVANTVFTDADLSTMLGTSNVMIATAAATTGPEDINMESAASITWTAGNTLTLTAGNDINLAGTISGGGSLALNFGGTLSFGGTLTASSVTATGSGAGTTIQGPNAATDWTLSAAGGSLDVGSQTVTFSNVGTLVGGTGTDTLTGYDQDVTWTVSGSGSGNYGSQAFTEMENLVGGTMADTFDINGAHTGDLNGGAGRDTFNLNTGGDVTGSIIGGAGIPFPFTSGNTYVFNGGTFGTLVVGDDGDTFVINAPYTGDLMGGAGTDWFHLNTGGSVTGSVGDATGQGRNRYSLNGGTYGSLVISDDGNTFEVNAPYTGDLMGGAGTDWFHLNTGSSVTGSVGDGSGRNQYYLNGGTFGSLVKSDDGNVFFVNAPYTGDLTGGAGADSFNLNAGGSVTGSVGDATGQGSNRYSLNGGTYGSLVISDDGNTFEVNAPYTGDLSGGAGDDWFQLRPGGSVTGSVGDGSGRNRYSLSGGTYGSLVKSDDGNRFEVSAPYTGDLTGGAGPDSFYLNTGGSVTGSVGDATGQGYNWYYLNGGTFGSLVISDDGNYFSVGAPYTGDLTGGAGGDIFVLLSGGSVTGSVGDGSGYNQYVFRGGTYGSLVISDDSNLFVVRAPYTGDLTGGAGPDIFQLEAGGSVTGSVGDSSGRNEFRLIGGTFGSLVVSDDGNRFDVSAPFTGDLAGGAGQDDFYLYTGVSVTGSISGGAGTDDFYLDSGVSVTGSISGGAGTDTLYGHDEVVTWTVSGAGAGLYGSQAFTGMENLVGGTMADTFDINGAHVGDLSGDAGADVFMLGAVVTGTVSGDAGADTFTLEAGGSATMALAGGFDVDTLNGRDEDVTWTVSGDGSGLYGTQAFTEMENLVGGALADTFDINSVYTGDLSGGDGADVFNLNTGGSVTGSISGGAGRTTYVLNGGTVGGITAGDEGIIFDINVAYTGDLTGGAGADVFNLNTGGSVTGSISGGAGSNTYVLNGGTITGSITAGNDGDTFDVNMAYTGNLTGGDGADTFLLGAAVTGTVSGGAGDDTFTLEPGGSSTMALAGGADTDTLNGRDEDVTWTVSGGGAGNYGGSQAFTGMENLVGGSMADTFDINGAYTGGLSGGDGADVFNLNTGGSVTGSISGGAGRTTYVLNGGTIGGITAGDEGIIFDINVAYTGDLTGGAGADVFNLNTGGSVSGSISGGAGGNTYVLNGGTITGGITAGNDGDTFDVNMAYTGDLTGGDGADTFLLGAVVTGTVSGGAGDDTFTLETGGSSTMALAGGADTDTLNGRDEVVTWAISGSGGGDYGAQAFTGMEDLVGGTMADTFDVNGAHVGDLSGDDGADIFMLGGAVTGTVSGGAGADTFTLETGGSSTMALAGGVDTDTLNGRNEDVIWTVSGSGAGSYGSQAFTGMEDLVGGTMADTFDVNGAHAGDLSGGGGADVFMLGAVVTGTVSGGAGGDTFTLEAGGSSTMALAGGADTDTLNGRNEAVMWTVSGSGGGDYGSQAFTGMEDLVGGTMADTFDINGDHVGDLSGGGGADVFMLGGVITGTVSGDAGADTFTLETGGTATVALAGGADADTLNGRDEVVTWTVSGSGSGNYGSQAFTEMENLVGGSMADTFDLQSSGSLAGSIRGGAGGNTYQFNGGGATGGVMAGDDGDTFDINMAYTGDLTGGGGADEFMLGAAVTGTVSGGAGGDTFTLETGGSATSLAGGAGTDTLNGRDEIVTWTVSGSGGGDYGGQAFTEMEDLVGGAMADTFDVNGAHVGDLSGGGGADVFNLDAAVTGTVDGGAGADTLNGRDADVTWVVNAMDAGTYDGQTFMGIENLVGGTMVDTFNLQSGGSLTGSISGGGGASYTDYLLNGGTFGSLVVGNGLNDFNINAPYTGDLSGRQFELGAAVTGTLRSNAGAFTLLPGGSATLLDGGGMSCLDASILDEDGTWTITGDGRGDYNGQAFTGMVDLIGSRGVDTFNVNGAIEGAISGEEGADVFNLGAAVGIVYGGGGDDTFILNAGGSVTSRIDGQEDVDTLRGRNEDVTWTVGQVYSQAFGGVVNIGSAGCYGGDAVCSGGQEFRGMENLVGGTGADTFDINGDHVGDLSGGGGADVFMLGGVITGTVSGGAGGDTFTLETGGSSTMALAGGAGTDTLNGRDEAETWTISSSGSGNYGSQAFTEMENLVGGSMVDTFDLQSGGSLAGGISGGAGSNVYQLNGGSATGGITAGDDGDTFDINMAYTGDLTGGDGADTFLLGAAVTGTVSGGAGADVFTLETGGSSTMALAGGADTDTLNGRDEAVTWTVSGGGGGNYGGGQAFTGMENLVGGSGRDTFNVAGAHTGDLSGGAGRDTFNLDAGGAVTGSIRGGAGGNFYNLNGGTVTGGILAGDDGETFDINAAYTGDLSGGAGGDTFRLGAVVTGTISGGAGGDEFYLEPGGSAMSLAGEANPGDDRDILWGRDEVVTWTVSGGGAGCYGGDAACSGGQAFTGMEVLFGGNMADTFDVSGAHTGDLRSRGGADVFRLGAVVTGFVAGGDGDDEFFLEPGGMVTWWLEGDADVDTLHGHNGDVTWTITGSGSGCYGGDAVCSGALTFRSGIENLVGGTGADTFDLQSGGSLTGSIRGGAGRNTYQLNGGTVTGGITAGDDGDTFAVNMAYVGGALTGGAGADTFDVDAAVTGDLSGGAGADVFMLGAVVTGEVSGGAGADVFTLEMGGSSTMALAGGADTDTLLNGRDDEAVTWTVSGGGAGCYGGDAVCSGGQAFTGMEDLVGGLNFDTFDINGAHTGDVSGQSRARSSVWGRNTFLLGAAVTGTVGGGSAANIFILEPGGSATSLDGGGRRETISVGVLIGRDEDVTWTVTGGGAGCYGGDAACSGGQAFTRMVALLGGTMADTFHVTGVHPGSLVGDGGIDTDGGPVAFDDDGGNDTFILEPGGLVEGQGLYQGLIGGAGTDTLRGRDENVTWTVGRAVRRVLEMDAVVEEVGAGCYGGDAVCSSGQAFRGMENLVGGTGADTFDVSGAHTGDLSGGAGADVFNLDAALTGSITGGSGSNTYQFNSGGSVSGAVMGGADADTFGFNGGSVAGMVRGDGGDNHLDYTDVSTAVSVVLTGLGGTVGFTGTATSTGGFGDITELTGGSGTDSLTGRDAASQWALATGDDTYTSTNTLRFRGVEDMQGGSGVDTFTATGDHDGDLRGGGGDDVFALGPRPFPSVVISGVVDGEADGDRYVIGPNARVAAASGPDIADTGSTGTDTLVSDDPRGGMFGSAAAPSQGVYSGNTNPTVVTSYAGVEELSGNPSVATNVLDFSGSGVPVRFYVESGASGGYSGRVVQQGNIDGTPFNQETRFQGINTVRGRELHKIEDADALPADDPGDTLFAREDTSATFGVLPLGQAELSARAIDMAVSGEPNQGFYATGSSGDPLFFIAVENLVGSRQSDYFRFFNGGRLQGGVWGLEGSDMLDLRGYRNRVTAYLYAEFDGVGERPDVSSARARETLLFAQEDGGIRTGFGGIRTQAILTPAQEDSGMQTGVGGNVQADDGSGGVVEVLANYRGIEQLAAAEEDSANEIGGANLVVTPFDPRLDAALDTPRTLMINPQEDGESVEPEVPAAETTESRVSLPDLVDFPGTVLLGGTLSPALPPTTEGEERVAPEVVLPDEVRRTAVDNPPGENGVSLDGRTVYAERTVIAGQVGVPGHLVVIGNDLELQADLAAGVPVSENGDERSMGELVEAAGKTREVVLWATGDREVDGANTGGDIEVGGSIGDEINIYGGSGTVIAERGIENSESLLLDFMGGDLQFAVSPAFFSSSRPSILSQANGVNLDPALEQFIRELGLDASGFLVIFVNPAGFLSGVLSVVSIDTSLFEEDLTLFGILGEGLAKSLSQCEEEEGCVPNITFGELEGVIEKLRLRITQLENLLQSEQAESKLEELRGLLVRFNSELRTFLEYRREYLEVFGPGASRAVPVPEWHKFWLSPDAFRAMLPPGRMTDS